MIDEPALLIEDRGPVVILTLNRPDRLNALSLAVVSALETTLEALAARSEVRVVIVAGAGGRSFCTGADLKERAAMSAEEARAFVERLRALMDAVAAMPCAVIAAIEGFALGGGLELALACDIRIAGESARLGLTEVRLGIIPGAGGTQRLPRVVGLARARELILTGRRIQAQEAAQIGLVNEVVAEAMAVERALVVADEICLGAPLAVREAKRALDGGYGLPLEQGLVWERAGYEVVLASADRREALAAFAEKRPPRFEGR